MAFSRSILLLFALAWCGVGMNTMCSQVSAQTAWLTPFEIKEDLRVFKEAFLHHPGLLLHRSQHEMDSVLRGLDAYANQNTESTELRALYWYLLEQVVFVQDGHSGLSMGKRLLAQKRPRRYLPFSVAILEDGVYIKEAYTPEAASVLYAELLSINGLPIDSVLAELYRHTPSDADNIGFKRHYNERIFYRQFDDSFGPFDDFIISAREYRTEDYFQTELTGIAPQTMQHHVEPQAPMASSLVPDSGYALLTVNTFHYRQFLDAGMDFHEELLNFFQELKRENIHNLVLDLRENFGGSSLLAMTLFAFLTDQDFQWVQRSHTLLDGSEAFALHTPFPDGGYPFFTSHDSIASGEGYWLENGPDAKARFPANSIPFGPKQRPKDIGKWTFDGELLVLTSGMTFSAASILASKLKDSGRGMLIGTESGSAHGIFCGGGLLTITLPHSGIVFTLPVMQRHIALSIGNKGGSSGVFDSSQLAHGAADKLLAPTKPDVHIPVRIEDLAEGRDPVMEWVVEYLSKL